MEVNVPLNHDIRDFVEFIDWSGAAEPDFNHWNLLTELWDDWLNKQFIENYRGVEKPGISLGS